MTFLSRITSSGKSVEPRKKFKPGDKVRVTRAIKSNTEGWDNHWVPSMDPAVGKIGTVISDFGKTGVSLDVPGVDTTLSYPASVLQLITEPKTQPAVVSPPKTLFYVGQRVNVDYLPQSNWNGPAIIWEIYTPNSICVIPESGEFKNKKGEFRPEQLTPISVPSASVVPAPKPLFSKSIALTAARRIAIELATKNGKVTADDVQFELQRLGVEQLGNQAGSIFSGFVNSGTTVKSKREGNRGRRIIVWNLKAAPPTTKSESKKYVVEVKRERGGGYDGYDWTLSHNKDIKGQILSSVLFDSFSEADSEATRQQQIMRRGATTPSFSYRAAEAK